MGRERERKFDAGPGFELPDLDGIVEGVTADEPREVELEALYHDTEDLRLLRWGCTLRHRTDEGWTLKLPPPGAGQDTGDKPLELSRQEVHLPGEPGTMPQQAVTLTRSFAREAPLERVARLVQRRRTVLLRDGEGDPLLEIDADEVSVHIGRRMATRFHEVEIERLADGADDLVDRVVERLREAGIGEPVSVPKLVRALGRNASAPPDVELPALDDPTAGDLVHHALARSAVHYVTHAPYALLGDDPEGVHQARAATRRLRSDLRTFRASLDDEAERSLRERLRPLAQVLGQVRDADVLLERLEQLRDEHEPRDRAAAEPLVELARSQREDARDALQAALAGDLHVDALGALYEAAAQPPLVDGAAQRAETLRGVVDPPWKKLRERVRALPSEPEDEHLHDVRILVKRVRYAAEAVAPVVGEPASTFARSAARLQDVLGTHQDATSIRAWLRQVAADLDPQPAFVAGEFAGAERARQAHARDRWHDRWERLDRRALRRWMQP